MDHVLKKKKLISLFIYLLIVGVDFDGIYVHENCYWDVQKLLRRKVVTSCNIFYFLHVYLSVCLDDEILATSWHSGLLRIRTGKVVSNTNGLFGLFSFFCTIYSLHNKIRRNLGDTMMSNT